jgi:RNA polymerase sigma factor (sigma-70 family)
VVKRNRRPSLRGTAERNALVEQWKYLPAAVAKAVLRWSQSSRQDYEDATQAAFLGLIRAAELFDETRGLKFCTYAWHHCRASIQAEARRQAKARPASLDMDRDAAHVPEPADRGQPPGTPAGWDDVRRALDALPADRDLIERHYLDGDTQRELAARCGVSYQRVQQRLGVAMGKLREALTA